MRSCNFTLHCLTVFKYHVVNNAKPVYTAQCKLKLKTHPTGVASSVELIYKIK